jgi:hypothetical protein
MSDMDGYRAPECPTCGLDPCDCPSDADAPILCAHGKNVDTWCAACTVAAEMTMAGMLARMLAKIQQREDEAMGADLAARFHYEGE